MIVHLVLAALTAAPACLGADPALISTAVKNVTNNGGLNHYHLSGTVTNVGSLKQASNTLQFVDVFLGRSQKVNSIGIPPLKPGQSYTFGWTYDRSAEAGEGTKPCISVCAAQTRRRLRHKTAAPRTIPRR